MLFSYLTVIRAYARAMRENDVGATAVEYGLMLALIAAVIVAAVTALGPQIAGVFSGIIGGFKPPGQ